jgi:hypothetical protein
LQFANWHTYEICGFAIAKCAQEFGDLRFSYKKIYVPTFTLFSAFGGLNFYNLKLRIIEIVKNILLAKFENMFKF